MYFEHQCHLWCRGCSGTNSNLKNLHKIATAIFIWRYAESFPRQILGPACISINMKPGQLHIYTWKAVNLNGDALWNSPFFSHLSGLNEAASGPQLYSILPMEYGTQCL